MQLFSCQHESDYELSVSVIIRQPEKLHEIIGLAHGTPTAEKSLPSACWRGRIPVLLDSEPPISDRRARYRKPVNKHLVLRRKREADAPAIVSPSN